MTSHKQESNKSTDVSNSLVVKSVTGDAAIDLALDTIERGKQALLFVNTKQGAERCAEDISKKIRDTNPVLQALSQDALQALSKPTKQCERLSLVVKKGIAFHHAGLVQKQKELVEDNFRLGNIKIICCTPTLAAGVNLPAYRTIIRDLRRFGHRGMAWIPVLEYHQQAGRAGRPGFDDHGVAITIAAGEAEMEEIVERFIKGEPEEIYSKLAVEPVLRTYILSLIASNLVRSEAELLKFFSKTFWAHQFEDMPKLAAIIRRMIGLLMEWEFIESANNARDGKPGASEGSVLKDGKNRTEPKFIIDDFLSAADMIEQEGSKERLSATALGRKVAELYVDPLTAHDIIIGLKRSVELGQDISDFSLLQLVCHTLEMRPLLSVKVKEWEDVQERLTKYHDRLLDFEPTLYDEEYETFLASVKTAFMIHDWIEEKDEEYILETYSVRPGELKVKLDLADWLLYSAEELSRIMNVAIARREIMKLRVRVSHGAKEELLPLLKLKNIGRVRARKLFAANIRDLSDVKRAQLSDLAHLIGPKNAIDIKQQVGEEVDPEKLKVKENKRKGQMNLNDY